MLSVRSAVVAAVLGICLWGLFSMLDILREPGLMRTQKSTAIKGCEQLDTDETRSVCPQLFCQKAMIEKNLVSYKTRFAVVIDKQDHQLRLIGGNAGTQPSTEPTAHFACLVQDAKVVAVKLVKRAELDNLASQSGNWNL